MVAAAGDGRERAEEGKGVREIGGFRDRGERKKILERGREGERKREGRVYMGCEIWALILID